MKYIVEIVRYSDGGVEHRLGPFSTERAAYRAEDGVNINLDHTRFFTRVLEVES